MPLIYVAACPSCEWRHQREKKPPSGEQIECACCGNLFAAEWQEGKEDEDSCPFCSETIRAGATKCKHCGEFLEDSQVGISVRKTSVKKGTPSGNMAKAVGWLCLFVAIVSAIVGASYLNPTNYERLATEAVAAAETYHNSSENSANYLQDLAHYLKLLGAVVPEGYTNNSVRHLTKATAMVNETKEQLASAISSRERKATIGFSVAAFFTLISVICFVSSRHR